MSKILVRFGGNPTYKAATTCLRKVSFAIQLGVAGQCVACRQECQSCHTTLDLGTKIYICYKL